METERENGLEAEVSDPAAPLEEARRALERAALDAPLLQAERAYLSQVSTRLGAIAARIREEEAPPVADALPRRPSTRYYTRKEAARLLQVHPNTLLNWEERGLLVASRDWRGWRTYGRDELARAMAVAGHLPAEALNATPVGSRGRRRRAP